MYQMTLQRTLVHILPAILAFAGTVWGVLRLIAARRLKSRFARTSIDEQQESLQSDMRKIQQLMYSPIAFLMSCGILFPVYILIYVFTDACRIFERWAYAGAEVEWILILWNIKEALASYALILCITLFVWALHFYFNHAHRKLILDMCCLAGSE